MFDYQNRLHWASFGLFLITIFSIYGLSYALTKTNRPTLHTVSRDHRLPVVHYRTVAAETCTFGVVMVSDKYRECPHPDHVATVRDTSGDVLLLCRCPLGTAEWEDADDDS